MLVVAKEDPAEAEVAKLALVVGVAAASPPAAWVVASPAAAEEEEEEPPPTTLQRSLVRERTSVFAG